MKPQRHEDTKKSNPPTHPSDGCHSPFIKGKKFPLFYKEGLGEIIKFYCLLPIICCLIFSGCGGGGDTPATTSAAACTQSSSAGSISVSSKPGGASIYIDGADTGQTTPVPSGSIALSSFSEGTHAVKLSLSGHNDYQTTICVSAGSMQTVSQQLSLSADISNSY